MRDSWKGTLLKAGLLSGSLALFGIAAFLLFRSRATESHRVLMLTDIVPLRALLAKRLAEEAPRHGVAVQLSEKAYPALDALELVDSFNSVNLALVPGGVTRREYPNLRHVTLLTVEPMHVLIRPDLPGTGFGRLRGKVLNLGPEEAPSHHVARDLLAFAGLQAPADSGTSGDYRVETIAPDEIQRTLARIEGLPEGERAGAIAALPDALFLLAPMPSLVARNLVRVAGYRLEPIPFADAYCLDRLTPSVNHGVRIDRAAISPVEIPAYTYGADPAVPPTPCRTISTRLMLIADVRTEPDAVRKLLAAVFDGPLATLLQPPPLRDQIPQFPLHPGAERYLRRNDPLLTPELETSLGKIAGGIGAFGSGIVAFYGFLRVLQLRRFESYYEGVRQIEMIARGQLDDPEAPEDPRARRAYLEDRLLDLKCRCVADFAEGGLKGEMLMAGVVALINDTRSTLDRITLPGEFNGAGEPTTLAPRPPSAA